MTLSPEQVKLAKSAFRMPSVQDMMSRKSSITNAFACAIVPSVEPSPEEIIEALRILSIDPRDPRCVFCGTQATEWDHLRPLVLNRRATGFISEIANLVPACGKCNQSKGNKPWRDWMRSKAKHSPTGKGVPDVEKRIRALERYEQWGKPRQLELEQIIGSKAWSEYWSMCDEVISELKSAKAVADGIRDKVTAKVSKKARQ